MTKYLVAVAVSLLSFLAGLGGVYMAMPTVAPKRTHEAKAHVDSLKMPPQPGPHGVAAGTDSAVVSPSAPDSSQSHGKTRTAEARADAPITHLQAVAGADSIRVLRQRLEQARLEREALQKKVQNMESSAAEKKPDPAVQQRVSELSATLGKLEDKELRQILVQLDTDVVRILYEQASARNRTRLLQSMPSERAAQIVQRLAGRPAPAARPAAPVQKTSAPGSSSSN